MREQRIEKIMDTTRNRFADYQFTVDELAREVGMSVSYLREIVHIHYGMCPHELIETVRLEEALRAICRNHMDNPYIICSSVGYISLRTFLDAFKKRVGVTPTDWKRSISGNGKAETGLEKAVKFLWMKNPGGEPIL